MHWSASSVMSLCAQCEVTVTSSQPRLMFLYEKNILSGMLHTAVHIVLCIWHRSCRRWIESQAQQADQAHGWLGRKTIASSGLCQLPATDIIHSMPELKLHTNPDQFHVRPCSPPAFYVRSQLRVRAGRVQFNAGETIPGLLT